MRIIALRQFVTPQTIWLTTVIRLYCDGTIIEQDTAKVLSFITARLLPGVPGTSTTKQERYALSTELSLADLEAALGGLQASPECDSVKQFGPCSAWQVFVIRHYAIVHLDALQDYIIKTEDLFTGLTDGEDGRRCILAKHSLFGAFVQRMALSFSQEGFNSHMSLWYEFAKHRAALIDRRGELFGKAQIARLGHVVKAEGILEGGSESEDSLYGLIAKHEEVTRSGFNSNERLDSMLRFQIGQMQRFGARLGPVLEKRLTTLMHTSREDSTLSHYFSFLSAWYAGDYPSALDNLHRYYDYTMPDNTLLKSRYPYACLNMAVLQADFDCVEEALPAIREAITTAREAKDHDCLAFCLSWLYHFSLGDESEETQIFARDMLGGENAGLKYLLQQAHEQKLHDLESSILITQAKAVLARGTRPLEALKLLHMSSTLNLLYGFANLVGTNLLVQSSLFGELGLNDISRAYIDLALFWYKDDMPISEGIQASCYAANTYTSNGDFEGAKKLLAQASQLASGNLKHIQLVSRYANLIAAIHAVDSGSCSEAELFIEALSKTPCSEASLMWECSLLEIEFHISVLDYSGAFRRIEDLLIILENSASRSGVPIRIRIRLLNLKARVFIEADRAPKALSLTLKAAVAAYKARLSILMWESIALLAHVMQSLGCHETAIELALMCVEQARDGGSMKVLALLLSALAGSYQALYAMSLRSRSEAAAVHRIEANRWFAEARGSSKVLRNEDAFQRMLAKVVRCEERISYTSRKQDPATATLATMAENDRRQAEHAEWDFSRFDVMALTD